MAISKTIKQYLDNRHIVYSVLELPHFESPNQAASLANIPSRSLYYPVVLRDGFGLMMAVLPASHKMNVERLAKVLGRNIGLAYQTQLSSLFADCQPGQIPPIGQAYGLRTVIDAALSTPEEVYIVAGDHSRLIKLSRKDFMMLQSNALLASEFAEPLEPEPTTDNEAVELEWDKDLRGTIKERVEQSTELPAMPEMAVEIFRLRADPMAEIKDLAKAVEKDPSLTAQVMRYANSPFFGFQGKIDSVQVAITRVLGFDMVVNLAMGLALAKPFKIPRRGEFGLDYFWRHSVYSATVMQILGKQLARDKRLRTGTCYLIGLLHDFGYLVLGHLFRDKFDGLSHLVEEQGRESLGNLERDYLGVTHGELGAWLFKAWNLPDELVYATREHHNEAYQGPHEVYVKLAHLTDLIVESYFRGDLDEREFPEQLIAELGLTSAQVFDVMTHLIENENDLGNMARQLAA